MTSSPGPRDLYGAIELSPGPGILGTKGDSDLDPTRSQRAADFIELLAGVKNWNTVRERPRSPSINIFLRGVLGAGFPDASGMSLDLHTIKKALRSGQVDESWPVPEPSLALGEFLKEVGEDLIATYRLNSTCSGAANAPS